MSVGMFSEFEKKTKNKLKILQKAKPEKFFSVKLHAFGLHLNE